MNNGRVDTIDNANYDLYKLSKDGNDKLSQFSREAIINIHHQTPLNDLFFSRLNMTALQQGIRNLVASKSNGEFVIDNQSEVELQVIMRAIYLQHAKHDNENVIEQVKELNSKILDFCVPRIMEEIRMYKFYRNDISKLPTPLERGSFVSSKGEKVNVLREF
jgi:hypothetical protein